MIFIAAFILGFVLYWFQRKLWLALSLPPVALIAWILLDEFVLPYRGGGASMWPIAVLVGVPAVVLASLAGAVVARAIRRHKQGSVE